MEAAEDTSLLLGERTVPLLPCRVSIDPGPGDNSLGEQQGGDTG